MRILYISRSIRDEQNGANQVMRRNRKALKEIATDENFIELTLPSITIKGVLKSILSDSSYGIPKQIEDTVVKRAVEFNPDIVFIDSSSYGSLCKKIHLAGLKTVAFAHNLDTALCRYELKSRSPLIAYPKYWSIKRNERTCTQYSDLLICLTQRDSEAFDKEFGRKADLILPITFPTHHLNFDNKTNDAKCKSYLFVGSDFFPNVEGILWFIKNVAPFVDAKFRLVGSCCKNKVFDSVKIPDNVYMVGYAENIESEYLQASGVIAPIFKGSGMKTKTIEALSYGKSIFGTNEAFAGITFDYDKIGALCNTADEFIHTLNHYDGNITNNYSIQLFNNVFSDNCAKNMFIQLLTK